MNDPATPIPTPPVHAARLSALLKSLANAESSVAESIKARQALIEGLEKLLDTNRSTLAKEQSQVSELSNRKGVTEVKKREVEDAIMRGLSAENSPAAHGNGSPEVTDRTTRASEDLDPERPEVEELTPPPPESLTSVGSLRPDTTKSADQTVEPDIASAQIPIESQPTSSITPAIPTPTPGADLLSSLSMPPRTRPPSGSPPTNGTSAKKRKMSHGEDFAEFTGGDAMADLDADVADLLRQESAKFT